MLSFYTHKDLESHEHGIAIVFTRSNSANSVQYPNIYRPINAVLEIAEKNYLTSREAFSKNGSKRESKFFIYNLAQGSHFSSQLIDLNILHLPQLSLHNLLEASFTLCTRMLLCVHRLSADHGVATDVTWIAFHYSELIGQELTKIEEGSKNGLPVMAGTSSL